MADDRLRALARRWKETGSAPDQARYLRERLRAGELERGRLELAARFGSEAAGLALDGAGPPARTPVSAYSRWLKGWLEGEPPPLELRIQAAALHARALVSLVPFFADTTDPAELEAWEQILATVEDWVQRPEPQRRQLVATRLDEHERVAREFHGTRYLLDTASAVSRTALAVARRSDDLAQRAFRRGRGWAGYLRAAEPPLLRACGVAWLLGEPVRVDREVILRAYDRAVLLNLVWSYPDDAQLAVRGDEPLKVPSRRYPGRNVTPLFFQRDDLARGVAHEWPGSSLRSTSLDELVHAVLPQLEREGDLVGLAVLRRARVRPYLNEIEPGEVLDRLLDAHGDSLVEGPPQDDRAADRKPRRRLQRKTRLRRRRSDERTDPE